MLERKPESFWIITLPIHSRYSKEGVVMNENTVIIYQDENNVTKVSVRFSDEDIWLTQGQIAELYNTTQQNISQHIESIYKDEELERNSTNKKFLLVRTEGSRKVKRNIDHYNLVDSYQSLLKIMNAI